MSRLRQLSDVVDGRLCLGCGACAYICPTDRVELIDFAEEGIRPVVQGDDCSGCRACLDVCPTVQTRFPDLAATPPRDGELDVPDPKKWGRVVGIWEGHAGDAALRYDASSGGLLTAIAAYCLDREGMSGVLHIEADPSDPIRNRTRLSTTPDELRAATGSRYSPASVCDGLDLVEAAEAPCVVIGKPVEIAGVVNASRMRPALAERIGATLSFFCAETPATQGTIDLVKKMGADPEGLDELRYRGRGWPGHFAPRERGADEPVDRLTYRESWQFLQAYRPWAIQMWPDRTGELADISCGDPWYESPDGVNPGSSLVVARTELGRQIVAGAIAAGYVELTEAEAWKLEESQRGLVERKGAIHGRRLASRIAGMPTTRFSGLDLAHCWKPLPWMEKLRATLGTLRRIVVRRLWRPLDLDAGRAKRVATPFSGASGASTPSTTSTTLTAEPALADSSTRD